MKGVYGVYSYQNMVDGVQKEEERGIRVAHVANGRRSHGLCMPRSAARSKHGGVLFPQQMRIEEHIREYELDYRSFGRGLHG